MTLQCEIEMVNTLKELEEMFEHFNDAKYIIALKYCRQRLEQEIRIEKQALELVVTHKKYDIEKPSKEDMEAALKINGEISKIINNYIKSEAKKHELNFGSILFKKGDHKDE